VPAGEALKTTNTDKRQELIRRLRERLAARRGHVVVLFCDEAQRQSKNAHEWPRDVHDQLAYYGIRLITLLVGQPQVLAQKEVLANCAYRASRIQFEVRRI
jgi:type II secretory pathway predicted ATPase ExeA